MRYQCLQHPGGWDALPSGWLKEMDDKIIKDRLESMFLGELLSLLEGVFLSQVANIEGWESAIDHHKQITNQAKAVAILALLKA